MQSRHTPAAIQDLFDDYDAGPAGSRTASPFLLERNGKLSLHFHTTGVQSLMDLEAPDELLLGYTRTMMRFRVFNDRPHHIGMVGLGGGSIAKYCYEHLPETRITVAEISPEVIALRDRFHIPKDDERFQVVCEDGVDFVKRHHGDFDVLIVDGFDSAGQPPELCTQEFYDSCFGALATDGILVVNICDSGRSMLVPRLRRAFENRVLVIDGEDSTNTIAFATRSTAELDARKLFPKGSNPFAKMPSFAPGGKASRPFLTRLIKKTFGRAATVSLRPGS